METPDLITSYAHCPLCGSGELRVKNGVKECGGCGHRIFNNPITAVAVFILDARNRVLLIRRAKDPAKGKWAPPGGFVDVGENLEEAALREVAEETGITLHAMEYIGSFPNNYIYQGLSRPVCDVFFTARVESFAVTLQAEEATAFETPALDEVAPEDLAFDSMRRALARLRSGAGFIL